MPSPVRIRQIYREELIRRSPARMEQAGANWAIQLQNFYFPGNEDAVDQCALVVLRRALVEDGTSCSDAIRRRVRNIIGTTTVTNNAIDVIIVAVFTPWEA